MAVNRIFLSVGFSTVISGNILEFKMTLKEPAVLMINRDEGLGFSSLLLVIGRRSFKRICPRPRSIHEDVGLSNK